MKAVVMLTNAVAQDKMGGLERYVSELASALIAAGRDVTVVAKRMHDHSLAEEFLPDGVRLIRYDAPKKSDPTFAVKYPFAVGRAVDRALASISNDAVVHAHFAIPAISPLFRRRPYVYTFHNPVYRELLPERHESYWLPRPVQGAAVAGLKAVERAVLQRAAQVICLSEFTRGEIATLDQSVSEQVQIIPGGIDLEKFVPYPNQASREVEGPLLVAARRFTPRTGLLQLVRAMPKVLDVHPTAQCALLGDGGSQDAVKVEAERLGLGSAVRFPGRMFDADLADWYRRADLVVMPTQELEGFGLTTVEALACGTPVLATPIGANPEVVAGLGPDFLAEGIGPEDIARGILRALQSIEYDPPARSVVRELVAPSMGWIKVAQAHLDLYQRAERAQPCA